MKNRLVKLVKIYLFLFNIHLINEDLSVVLVGQPLDIRQRADVAVHGEDAVGDDEAAAAVLALRQHPLEVRHVLVPVAELLALAQPDAVYDGGVVELVGEDGVLGPADLLEQPGVGVETRGVQDRVLAPVEFGYFLFQLLVYVLRAADESKEASVSGWTVDPMTSPPPRT